MKKDLPQNSEGGSSASTWSQTSSLQDCEKTDLCLSNSAYDSWPQLPSEPNAGDFVPNEVLTITWE